MKKQTIEDKQKKVVLGHLKLLKAGSKNFAMVRDITTLHGPSVKRKIHQLELKHAKLIKAISKPGITRVEMMQVLSKHIGILEELCKMVAFNYSLEKQKINTLKAGRGLLGSAIADKRKLLRK